MRGLHALDRTLHDLVAGDLPRDGALADLLGEPVADMDVDLPIRIRPILVALSARAAGAARVSAEAQHAAELLHLALIVHDLALGRSGGRRRRVARQILGRVGSSSLTLRALELARHASSPEVLGEAVDTLREIADGQQIAAQYRRGSLPDVDGWRAHTDGHAGAVFSFCCRAGGHLGGGDRAILAGLGSYGRHLGRLWNAAEDLLHLSGEGGAEHLLERTRAGRPILAVIAAEDPELARSLASSRVENISELLARTLAAAGAARRIAASDGWAARQALLVLPPSPYRQALDRIADSLMRS